MKNKENSFERPKSDVLLLQRTQCDQNIFKVAIPGNLCSRIKVKNASLTSSSHVFTNPESTKPEFFMFYMNFHLRIKIDYKVPI